MLIAVSLKLYFDPARTVGYCRAAAALAAEIPEVAAGTVGLAVLPSFLSIPAAAEVFAGTPVRLGAQDLGPFDRGPYTGEVSGADLRHFGCSLVEVGHAERRRLFGEDESLIAAKVAAAVRNELAPLLCVGEAAPGDPKVAAQQCAALVNSATAGRVEGELWIGYEPVWAIGAEQPAPPDYVREVCTRLRELTYGRAQEVRILYGGSAGPGLLTQLWGTVDGLFLGRFAHDPQALRSVLSEAVELQRKDSGTSYRR